MRRAYKHAAAAALVLSSIVAPAGSALAQAYPTRPITLVVAFAAGGFADGVARLLGGKLSEKFGQSVVIENRVGGGGNIAAAAVAKATPDGHTLLVTTTGLAINETLTKEKGFALDDLKVIAIPSWAPETLSVHPSSPAKTTQELVQLAKTKPINYASPGVGTSGHIANAYFFKALAKVEAVHIPFSGGAPAVNAAAGGHVDALTGAIPTYAGQLQGGVLRGLGFATEKRLERFSNIPTYTEAGFGPLVAATWIGVFAPGKTSDAIVDKVNAAINEIVRDPASLEQFKKFNTEVREGDRADAAAYFNREVAQWKTMIGTIGLGQ